jgi:hypothetical protein
VAVGFSFYDAQADGNLLYSEQQTVTAAKGIFHVLIGNGANPQGQFAAICTGNSVWLELTVAGQAMAPRQRIGSVVFALKAGAVADHEERIAALEALLANLSRQGDTLLLSGMNLQIVNGTGATDGAVNGTGNLIVGYNELRGDGDDRTGSHNMVVGKEHNFSSYGGFVAGSRNTLSNGYCSVSGGLSNTASGESASVSGGSGNTAIGTYASVSGGAANAASGLYATVSGGAANTASGDYSSVSGGYKHTAGGGYNWAAGGLFQAQ